MDNIRNSVTRVFPYDATLHDDNKDSVSVPSKHKVTNTIIIIYTQSSQLCLWYMR
jgi:hypothetical protein